MKKHMRTSADRMDGSLRVSSGEKLTWIAFVGGLALATWGLSALSANAAQNSTEETIARTEAEYVAPEQGRPTPWALLGGLDAGYANLSVEKRTGEVDKQGFKVDVKALASYYFETPWVMDLGLGWNYTSVSGENSVVTEKNILRSGFVEFSPRYRIGTNWQLGPVIDYGFGADLTLGQPFTDRKLTGWYPGIELLHESSNPKQITRVGGRITTSMSIPNRTLIVAQLTLHFGGPLGGKTESQSTDQITHVASTETVVKETVTDLSQVPAPLPEEEVQVRVIDRTQVSVELSKEVTKFGTGSAKLSPRSREFLRRMGAYLNDRNDQWTRADIGGHTDIRGRLAYNMMLSKRRASSVAAALVSGGASARKITMEGYGPKIPIDARYNEDAWSKNRRVEIRISGSPDAAALADGIVEIKTKTEREYQIERVKRIDQKVERRIEKRVEREARVTPARKKSKATASATSSGKSKVRRASLRR